VRWLAPSQLLDFGSKFVLFLFKVVDLLDENHVFFDDSFVFLTVVLVHRLKLTAQVLN